MVDHRAKAIFRHENAIARHRLALRSLLHGSPDERKYSRWRIAAVARRLELAWELEDSREALLSPISPPPAMAPSDIPDQEQEARAWGDKPEPRKVRS